MRSFLAALWMLSISIASFPTAARANSNGPPDMDESSSIAIRTGVGAVASNGEPGPGVSQAPASRPTSAPSRYTALPTAEQIDANLLEFGAHDILWRSLWPDQHVFEDLLLHIESGDETWLDIAERLRAVSDAGATELLTGSMTIAIEVQPEAVLRRLSLAPTDSHFSIGDVCSARFAFIEQPDEERRWRMMAKRAIVSERDSALSAARDSCLAAMK